MAVRNAKGCNWQSDKVNWIFTPHPIISHFSEQGFWTITHTYGWSIKYSLLHHLPNPTVSPAVFIFVLSINNQTVTNISIRSINTIVIRKIIIMLYGYYYYYSVHRRTIFVMRCYSSLCSVNCATLRKIPYFPAADDPRFFTLHWTYTHHLRGSIQRANVHHVDLQIY